MVQKIHIPHLPATGDRDGRNAVEYGLLSYRGCGDQCKLLRTGQLLDLKLAPHGLCLRGEGFLIDQGNGQAGTGVFCTASCVMRLNPVRQIIGPASIERMVGAADDINIAHFIAALLPAEILRYSQMHARPSGWGKFEKHATYHARLPGDIARRRAAFLPAAARNRNRAPHCCRLESVSAETRKNRRKAERAAASADLHHRHRPCVRHRYSPW